MTVEEEGGRTRVTLLAADLFASGSATLNDAHAGVFARLARAIDQVPGRVMVIGHTDDQRVKSLRFRDNFELSRERARGVAATLQGAISTPARIQFNGVGSTEPRYRPETEAGNRARNRRVEIIHLSES
jgi:type VI secretion system protein ImpK